MSAKSLQYITLAIACAALIVAVAGCFTPTQETASNDVTALIVDKTDAYVTVSVDADASGSLEVWCKGKFGGTINYDAGNHVYIKQMNSFISTENMSSLEIRYR